MQTKFWLKLFGVALLLHVVLVVLSIGEVAVYSYLIEPGKDQAFYNAHAQVAGPWVSGIGGSLIIFLVVRNFVKKSSDRHLEYAMSFPVAYIALDILMLLSFNIDWSEHLPIFLMANIPKVASALLAYLIFRPAKDAQAA